MSTKFPTPQEHAMAWLLEATEIGGMSRPETALYAYQAGFKAALDLAIEIENALCEPDACFASMFVRQVRQCFSAVWADGFPRCRHRFPVM